MSQAEKITPQDELEELLGFKPEPEPEDDEAPPAEVEDDPAPEPDEEPAPEPEAEPEPIAAETKDEPQENDGDKRAKALQAEVTRLRRELREREQRERIQFAPPPTQPTAVPVEQAKKPAGVPVRVSEDGSSVYVDPAELERLVEERAARALEDRLKPTPEQVRAAHAQRTVQAFAAENPEVHIPLIRSATEAMGFVKLSLQNAMQTTGATAYTPDDLVSIARENGIQAQVEQFFPELAPHLDELIQADATENVAWQASIMRRIASGMQREEAPVAPVRQLRPVSNAPKSLARKGGDRSPAPSVEAQEFDQLEREFRRDPVFYPAEKRKRMEALGVKLGKTGYV